MRIHTESTAIAGLIVTDELRYLLGILHAELGADFVNSGLQTAGGGVKIVVRRQQSEPRGQIGRKRLVVFRKWSGRRTIVKCDLK